MITIGKYVKPSTLDEAYESLQAKNAQIIGGGAFIKMGSKRISTAIDLSNILLEAICEYEDHCTLGAMTTLHDVESNKFLKELYGSFLEDSVKDLTGVQLRNMATYGGTVYSRYGFSDPNTALLALDAKVKFHSSGTFDINTYFENGLETGTKDILTHIILPKDADKLSFKAFRNSKGDYAILNCAVARRNGKFNIAVGARPNRSKLATRAMEYLNSNPHNKETIEKVSIIASEELVFGTNSRASGEYRREICKVLVKRALTEVLL